MTDATAHRIVYRGFEGIELVADERGDPHGRPVLFLHGGGQTRHAWGRTAEEVAKRGWRAISLDLRGHGESEWASNGDYSFTAFCADCICVTDQLGQPPVLVGASLGGMSAMLAEGTSDREVSSGLVLVDIAPVTNRAGIEKIGAFMRSGVEGFASLEEAAAAIAAYTPQRDRGFNPEGLRKVLRERDGKWHWHWDPAFISRERTEVVAKRFAGLLEVAMNNIGVPTMLIRGMLSDVLTQEGVDNIVARLPGIIVVEVPGAGHMIAGDQNNAFTNAVLGFLDEHVGD